MLTKKHILGVLGGWGGSRRFENQSKECMHTTEAKAVKSRVLQRQKQGSANGRHMSASKVLQVVVGISSTPQSRHWGVSAADLLPEGLEGRLPALW